MVLSSPPGPPATARHRRVPEAHMPGDSTSRHGHHDERLAVVGLAWPPGETARAEVSSRSIPSLDAPVPWLKMCL